MDITCGLCGKTISVPSELEEGQHVLCPFCQGKFSYDSAAASWRTTKPHAVRTASDAARSIHGGIDISAEGLREAIEACRQDAESNRYYSHAPAGARLFIGLIFFGRHFRYSVSLETITAALTEIEPELQVEDLRYLIRNETDPDMLGYLKGLFETRYPGLSVDEPIPVDAMPQLRTSGGASSNPRRSSFVDSFRAQNDACRPSRTSMGATVPPREMRREGVSGKGPKVRTGSRAVGGESSLRRWCMLSGSAWGIVALEIGVAAAIGIVMAFRAIWAAAEDERAAARVQRAVDARNGRTRVAIETNVSQKPAVAVAAVQEEEEDGAIESEEVASNYPEPNEEETERAAERSERTREYQSWREKLRSADFKLIGGTRTWPKGFEGVMTCRLPHSVDELYRFEIRGDALVRAETFSSNGHVSEMSATNQLERLVVANYMLEADGKTYLHISRKGGLDWRDMSRERSPRDVFYQDFAEICPHYHDLSFDVGYIVPNDPNVYALSFDTPYRSVTSSELARAIQKQIPDDEPRRPVRESWPRFRRKYVFTEKAVGWTSRKGIHYVPRTGPNACGPVYDAILLEERKEREYNEEQRRRIEEEKRQIEYEAREKYIRRVEEMARDAQLVCRIRRDKR